MRAGKFEKNSQWGSAAGVLCNWDMKNMISVGCGFVVALSAMAATASGSLNKGSCSFGGKKLFGKVQIVDSFPDITVQVVTSFPDVKVKNVTSFPDSCGKWQTVTSFPDIKVKFVTSSPDVKIQYVDSFPGMN
jgi:hypothetical protein